MDGDPLDWPAGVDGADDPDPAPLDAAVFDETVFEDAGPDDTGAALDEELAPPEVEAEVEAPPDDPELLLHPAARIIAAATPAAVKNRGSRCRWPRRGVTVLMSCNLLSRVWSRAVRLDADDVAGGKEPLS